MRIAVASGKGGTGKTLVATHLAVALSQQRATTLIDCDVEAPNAHLFLHPTLSERQEVAKQIPVIDTARCTQCGQCVEACEFKALALLGNRLLVFEPLCHGCGRCRLVCPMDAIQERSHVLGVLERGHAGDLSFAHGRLNIGEAMASPLIRELKRSTVETEFVVLDAPPGTACPVISTLHDVDVAVLVTEPTPFGLHDLRAAVGVARALGVPVGVVLNRADIGDEDVEEYCDDEGLPILLRIPFDRRIAEAGAQGRLLTDVLPAWQDTFAHVAADLETLT